MYSNENKAIVSLAMFNPGAAEPGYTMPVQTV